MERRQQRETPNTITMPIRPRQVQPPNISFTRRSTSFRGYADQYIAQNVGMRGEWNSVGMKRGKV